MQLHKQRPGAVFQFMFQQRTFTQLIEESGILGTRPPTKDGWRELKCRVCSDYKVRAGFLLEDEAAAYHCFNCGLIAKYHISHSTFSSKMQKVLDAFNIDPEQSKQVLFRNFIAPHVAALKIPKEARPASSIALPPTFIRLDPSKHKRAAAYLVSRGIDPSGEFYVDNQTTKWKYRVIIPVYNSRGDLVFYQGRSFIGDNKRWQSPDTPKTGVIFNHRMLYENIPQVLVYESMMDALTISGISLIGSELSLYHISELSKTRSQVVLVPNKDANGMHLIDSFAANGFAVSFPDIGDCTDINQAVLQYGKMYVEQQIFTSVTTDPDVIKIKAGVWML